MLDSTSQEYLRALDLHKAGRLDDAEEAYLVLLQKSPNHSSALHNMGVVLAQKRKQIEAISYFNRAIAVLPDYAEAYNNRGSALLALGRLDQALQSYNQSLGIKPDYWEASLNLANVLMRLNRHQDALNVYSKVLEITTDNYKAIFSSGLANLALGNIDAAYNCFLKTMDIRQAKEFSSYDRDIYRCTTRAKLSHDAEQFRYLSKLNFSDAELTGLADQYENLVSQIDWNKTPGNIVKLTEFERSRIARSYNLPVHLVERPLLEKGVINPQLNTSKITEQYYSSKPKISYFDNFLSKDTLYLLRKFLLESNIWHDFRHVDGFLAAYLENGLATPLLLQVAHDVKVALPDILGDLPLAQIWAFKKLQGERGIDLHADSGAVSLNFWVTPDEANLDPDGGGMVLYEKAPPHDWQLRDYSKDVKLIQDYLSRYKGKIIRIPYRENRAVLFKSELFHKSDLVNFKSGYKNHRINITMIFGFGRLS